MNSTDILLAGVAVLNIVLLFLLISLVKDVMMLKLLSQQLQTTMTAIGNKINMHDVMLVKIGNAFNELTLMLGTLVDKFSMMDDRSQSGSLYRTMDGKYMGTSLEDLIKKIQADGAEQSYLSQDEIEGLKRLFEDMDDNEDDNPNSI